MRISELPDKQIDARGLRCPLPVLRTKAYLSKMQAGEVLRVLATDRGSVKDLAAFAKQTGHELLSSTESEGVFEFFIRCKGAPDPESADGRGVVLPRVQATNCSGCVQKNCRGLR